MTPFEITLHIIEILLTFTFGAWAGRSRCHVAFEVDTEESRRETLLERICPCTPRKSWRKQVSAESNKSDR